jgi:hypothetical protein
LAYQKAASFELFFQEVCNPRHIKAKDNELFDERLYRSVLRQWKSAIRHLVWEKAMKNLLLSCLKLVNDNSITTAVITDPEAKLEKMETEAQEDCKLNLHPLFALKFTSHASFQCFVDESKVASLLYTNHRRPNLRMNDQVLLVFNSFYKQIYSQPKLF